MRLQRSEIAYIVRRINIAAKMVIGCSKRNPRQGKINDRQSGR
jgi:hypothetical protein